jgi:SWI/SNF-related matrix-associated actin-dependent regulator of chromatin subfamily A member 5
MGKRERRTVAYNENQLYQQQIAALGGAKMERKKKKETRLPRFLRLPKLEEWQMFDRDALYALQEEEEAAFKELPEEIQMLASGKAVEKEETAKDESEKKEETAKDEFAKKDEEEKTADEESAPKEGCDEKKEAAEDKKISGEDSKSTKKKGIDLTAIPPLLSEEKLADKRRLLSEGYVDWGRHHYQAFVKASAKYGRANYAKIAIEVGKPESAIASYSKAFWNEEFGKKRFSEHEYDRTVKSIERGEKKLHDARGLQRGTEVFLSLFDNPWQELEFSYTNCRDKIFTIEEDRHLLCWAHKVSECYYLAA